MLISKLNVGLKMRLFEGLSEPEFYVDLVYNFTKVIGRNVFSLQLRKIIISSNLIEYNLNMTRQSACLFFNAITVGHYVSFFNCTPVSQTSNSFIFELLVNLVY